MDSLWKDLRAWANNDAALFVGLANTTSAVIFFGLGFFYMVAWERRWFQSYKIDNDFPEPQKLKGILHESILLYFVAHPAALYFLGWPVFTRGENGVERFMSDQVPCLQEMLGHLVIFIALADPLNYFVHRYMHDNKYLYKNFHKQHHEFKVTTGLASHYAHPVNSLMDGVGNFIGPVLCCPHILTFLVWMVLLESKALIDHGGYDFPFTLAARHNYHHTHNKGSYTYFTTFWDYWLGTDADYRAWRDKMKEEQRVSGASQKLQ